MRQIIRKASNKYRIHFIGLGGIGISALGRYFLAQNWLVSGSDASPSPLTKELKKEGILAKIGHKKSNIHPKTQLVIYSQAIPSNNPELKAAKRLEIPTLSYPEALGGLTRLYKTVAIAGAHGKSTTTALVALILKEAGLDPTVVLGTKLKEFGNKNFRLGKSKFLVMEADEYKSAFLHYFPYRIVVTNIDREHLDYFQDLRDIKNDFLSFFKNLTPQGMLILNQDNEPLFSLKAKLKSSKTLWFSLKDKKEAEVIKRILKIPGKHNLSNALAAYTLSKSLNINPKTALQAIAKYRGSWRRMEYKGRFLKKALVFDDYAHHPTEIKATLSAFREKFPKSQIICVFQPHQLKRLKALFKEFTSCFDEADNLILIDTFQVTGRDEVSDNINSRKLTEAMNRRKKSPPTVYLPYSHELRSLLVKEVHSTKGKSLIVMMGAGDIVNLTPALLK